jgi:soluble lytic murein transglycosylase-like protein
MSLYASYYVVESPLNQELGPPIRLRKRDIPRDPLQSRMLIMLGSAVSTVLIFAMFVLPAVGASQSDPARTSSDEAARVSEQQSDVAPMATISPVFSPEVQQWRPAIERWAAEYQLDPDIVATIMQIESCGDPGALSHAGATGLFQVMPYHFETGENAWDPEVNANRGLKFYALQLVQTGGDVYRAFAGYNGGFAASGSSWDNWASETQRYYVWSKGIFDEAKAGLSTSPTLQRWLEAGGHSLCRQAASRLGIQ